MQGLVLFLMIRRLSVIKYNVSCGVFANPLSDWGNSLLFLVCCVFMSWKDVGFFQNVFSVNFVDLFKEPAFSFIDFLYCFSIQDFINFHPNIFYFLPSAYFMLFCVIHFFFPICSVGRVSYLRSFFFLIQMYIYKFPSKQCFSCIP